jgi:hypothetical protein
MLSVILPKKVLVIFNKEKEKRKKLYIDLKLITYTLRKNIIFKIREIFIQHHC